MSSIRARLNAGVLGVLALVFTASGFAVYGVLEAGMQREVERSLLAFLRSEIGPILHETAPEDVPPPRLRDEPRDEPGGPRRLPRSLAPLREPLLDPAERTDFFFQVWRGTEGGRSRALAGDLPRDTAGLAVVAFEDLALDATRCGPIELPLEGGRVPARALTVRLRPPLRPGAPRDGRIPPELTIVVARPTIEVEDTLARVRRVLLLAGLLGGATASLLLLAVVRRGLRPLEELRASLATLDVSAGEAGEGHAALSVRDPVAELQPVVAQLEALIARVRGELQRSQAFAADVAHELRTPLAGIRATLELVLSRRREPEAYERGARESLEIAARMQALVERLLDFARPPGARRVAARELDVAALAAHAWAPLAARAADRGLRLDAELVPVPLASDERLVERVLANLLDNAVSHADPDGTIELRLARDAAGIRLVLANPARTAVPEHAERAFDPFWRADESRSSTGEHAGLGLALCRRIVAELGGHVRARVADGRFVIELELPDLAGEPPSSSG